MVFMNYIYDMVVDTQFNKFHGRPFARVLYVFLMKAKMSVDVKLSSCQAVKAVCQGVWRRQDKISPVPGVNNAYPYL